MHVLTAVHDFHPDPGSGGSGRFVYETSRLLVEFGHDVSVVTRRRGDCPDHEVVEGIDVYRYDVEIADTAAPRIVPGLLRAGRQVADRVSTATGANSPDLLSVQGPVTSLLVGRLVDDDVPRVATFHSPWSREYRLRTRGRRAGPRRWLNAELRRRLERHLLSNADRVVTLSQFMSDQLHRTCGDVADPVVVPGGVDVERFSPASGPCEDVSDGDPAILTVRRLSPRMGLDVLLESFAEVLTEQPDAHLYVAGDGPMRDDLERAADRLGVGDSTTFLGFVPEQELAGAYAAADLFVLPTTALEGFGLATLEALASGTPVVGTAVGGTVEILSDLAEDPDVPSPVLVPPGDVATLARAMVEWASLPAAAQASAERACRRHAVENYTWERTVSRLAAEYADVLDRSRVPAPARVPEPLPETDPATDD